MKLFAIIVSGVAMTNAAMADDYYLGKITPTDPIYQRCAAMQDASNVDREQCLAKALQFLERDMRASLATKLASARQASAEKESDGLIGGAAARAWAIDITKAQAAWAAYTASECDGVVKEDHYGGSAAGSYMLACRIRHTAARIDELR